MLRSLSNRFEEERKVLGAEKSKLVKENELKKTRLEDLEKQLDDFVVVSSFCSLLRLSLDFNFPCSLQKKFNLKWKPIPFDYVD